MVKVKICGIIRGEDALRAVADGVDALGFIFVPSSVRFIMPEAAREIICTLPPFVTPVGVFVNAHRAEIMRVLELTGIRCLQLHGDELPEDTEGYPVPVCKGFRVRPDFNVTYLSGYHTRACLLDTFVEGSHGGTGRAFDWNIAVQAKQYARIILGGGITPQNVTQAIRTVRPYAIDVSSGVESAPGIKDAEKIVHLMQEVRKAG
jgi:phosphoribosylanthranilate isomerase